MKYLTYTIHIGIAAGFVLTLLPSVTFAARLNDVLDSVNQDDSVSVDFGEDVVDNLPIEEVPTLEDAVGPLRDTLGSSLQTFIAAMNTREASIEARANLSVDSRAKLAAAASAMRAHIQAQYNSLQGAENTETVQGIGTQSAQVINARLGELKQHRNTLLGNVNTARGSITERNTQIVALYRNSAASIEEAGKDTSELNSAIDALEATLSTVGQDGTDNAAAIATARAQVQTIQSLLSELQ